MSVVAVTVVFAVIVPWEYIEVINDPVAEVPLPLKYPFTTRPVASSRAPCIVSVVNVPLQLIFPVAIIPLSTNKSLVHLISPVTSKVWLGVASFIPTLCVLDVGSVIKIPLSAVVVSYDNLK